MQRMDRWVTWGLAIAVALAMAIHGPIHQLAHYHEFADMRAWLGIPNARDVLSNAGFAVVAAWGAVALGRRGRGSASWPGYALFFAALALTAAGSAYYHLAPDNGRLVWDRLPIALACAGLLAAVHGETHDVRRPHAITAALAAAALASVYWWSFTERLGDDDLRPYLFLQVMPLLLIPAWQAMRKSPRRDRIAFALAIALYVAAKAAELADHALLTALGIASGHTLKHLLATAASGVVALHVSRRDTSSISRARFSLAQGTRQVRAS